MLDPRLEEAVRERPTDAVSWFNLSNAYLAAESWSEAEHASRMSCKHMPYGADYGALNYQILAIALAMQHRDVDALKACNEAELLGYGGLFIEFERASILFRLRNLVKALPAANRCCAADWSASTTGDRSIFDSKRWILRGQILASLGRFDDALADFARTPHPVALLSKATTLEEAGMPAEALEAFLAAKEQPEVRFGSLKGAGRTCITLGLPKQAADFYKQALGVSPGDQEACLGWVQACDLWGHFPSIIEAYAAFSAIADPSADVLVNWGRALEMAGDFEGALAKYTSAIESDPGCAFGYFSAGDLLYKSTQYADAAHMYKTGLKHDPRDAKVWFALGNSFEKLGIADAAKTSYEQALTLDPKHEGALHHLQIAA